MARRAWVAATCVVGLLSGARLAASECQRFELSVLVDGTPAAEYASGGRTYIEAMRGRSFSLRLHNPTSGRVAVALAVDGLNVVDAKHTTARAATKWILDPGQTVEIPGWQISGATARRFFFTDTARSYAKWIGDIRNVGTIEAVFFREKAAAPLPIERNPVRPLREDAPAREPPSERPKSSAGIEGSVEGGVPSPEADRFAATGIGDRTSFPVRWVNFQEDPTPAATISLRYEYRRELIRLGVLPGGEDLYARDRGRGFERGYAPDPK